LTVGGVSSPAAIAYLGSLDGSVGATYQLADPDGRP
jgi:hypothetical protein